MPGIQLAQLPLITPPARWGLFTERASPNGAEGLNLAIPYPMSSPKEFLLFCSGVDRTLLERAPSDENKYVGIGGTIFFTGLLATLSAGYALHTVFGGWLLATLFGLVWGLMIFNLDRYIVSSMKRKGGFFGDFLVALPRLAMAVLLAVVISKPLELKIFEREIDAELLVMEQEAFKEQEDRVNARYLAQITDREAELVDFQQQLADKVSARNAASAAALAEADGTGGSGIRNMGPIYRAKLAEAEQAQAELTAAEADLLPRIEASRQALEDLRTEAATDVANLNRGVFGGMAARIDALHRLGGRSDAIWLASLFVTLLFIAIETAPIFTKLISPRSPYDHLLHEHEHVFAMSTKESVTERANDVKNRLRKHTEVGVHQTTAEIAARKAEIDAELRRHRESLNGGWA